MAFRSTLFVLLTLASAASLAAETSYQWTFNDQPGTALTKVGGPVSWSNDLDQTATTGRGTLRIRRGHSTTPNTFAPLPAAWAQQPLWLVVRVRGWNLSGKSPELVRLGFSSSDHEKTPSVVAQIKIAREDDAVRLSAEATGGGTNLAPVALRGAISNRTVIVVLHLDPAARTYDVNFRIEGASWQQLGAGTIADGRAPQFLRLGVSGPFDTKRAEYFDLDDLLVTTVKPADLP